MARPVTETWIDILLAAGIVWLAWRALTTDDLFKGVVFYIAFGLAMALTWVRLEAPDIALAEAAIGTGLTGVLLLDAVRHFSQPPVRRARPGEEASVGPDRQDSPISTGNEDAQR